MPIVSYLWSEVLSAEWPGVEFSITGDDLDTLEWPGEDRPSKAEVASRASSGWLKTARTFALDFLDAQDPEDPRLPAARRAVLSATTPEAVEDALLANGWEDF
jgi:hypothetical protein